MQSEGLRVEVVGVDRGSGVGFVEGEISCH
jgi:hypothetical protein